MRIAARSHRIRGPKAALRQTPPLRSTTAAYEKSARGIQPAFCRRRRRRCGSASTTSSWAACRPRKSSSATAARSGAASCARTAAASAARDSPAALDAPLDLSKADGVYVDAILTSDADVARRAWKLTLRTAASRSEIVYSAEWAPRGPDGVGGPTFVPFSDFKLARGPRIVEGAPPLNATQCASVYGFGLTLSRSAPPPSI